MRSVNLIRFWGSKPHNIVSNLIREHSKDGDIILDPFGGKGVTVIEALKMNRRVIYNDLNPYALFIAKNLSSPSNKSELEDAFNLLMKNIDTKRYPIKNSNQKFISLDWLYSARCKCGAKRKIRYITWSLLYERNSAEYKQHIDENKEKKLEKIAFRIYAIIPPEEFTYHELRESIEQDPNLKRVKLNLITRALNEILIQKGLLKVVGEWPLEIIYNSRCECGLIRKDVEKEDFLKLKKILSASLPTNYYHPTNELKYDNGKYFYKRRNISALDKLFTKRNLVVLSILQNEIESLRCSNEIKDALLFCLSSIIFASSKMQRSGSGAWSVGCYWVPPAFIERNVIELFKLRYRKLMKWKETMKDLYENYFMSGRVDDVLKKKASVAFLGRDARSLPIPNGCVNYIIVDPPQMDEIQYFELSFLTARWLKLDLPFEKEIVVNPRQGKDEEIYWNMLKAAFQEFTRVLKPGGRITIMLHGEEEYFRNFKEIFKALKLKTLSTTFEKYRFKNSFHEDDRKRLDGDYYITLEKTAPPINYDKYLNGFFLLFNYLMFTDRTCPFP